MTVRTHARNTDKASELERQVSKFRAEHIAHYSRVTMKGARLEHLISLRRPIRGLIASSGNAELCSVFYSNDAFRKQLSCIKKNFIELSELLELTISLRFKHKPETASTSIRIKDIASKLKLKAECEDGFTACLNDSNKAIPVYYLKYKNIIDTAGFIHSEYNIWFKGGLEFATGFINWPTGNGWKRVRSNRDLLTAISDSMKEDGLI